MNVVFIRLYTGCYMANNSHSHFSPLYYLLNIHVCMSQIGWVCVCVCVCVCVWACKDLNNPGTILCF